MYSEALIHDSLGMWRMIKNPRFADLIGPSSNPRVLSQMTSLNEITLEFAGRIWWHDIKCGYKGHEIWHRQTMFDIPPFVGAISEDADFKGCLDCCLSHRNLVKVVKDNCRQLAMILLADTKRLDTFVDNGRGEWDVELRKGMLYHEVKLVRESDKNP
jgi:hypothetical protein